MHSKITFLNSELIMHMSVFSHIYSSKLNARQSNFVVTQKFHRSKRNSSFKNSLLSLTLSSPKRLQIFINSPFVATVWQKLSMSKTVFTKLKKPCGFIIAKHCLIQEIVSLYKGQILACICIVSTFYSKSSSKWRNKGFDS